MKLGSETRVGQRLDHGLQPLSVDIKDETRIGNESGTETGSCRCRSISKMKLGSETRVGQTGSWFAQPLSVDIKDETRIGNEWDRDWIMDRKREWDRDWIMAYSRCRSMSKMKLGSETRVGQRLDHGLQPLSVDIKDETRIGNESGTETGSWFTAAVGRCQR
ncbi:hypothetical protein EVAR_58570_1 [Eumeta japonica]|uniref:Uncharacterized protein n=1 Tax=Eumeta variegata TaxID=151549 RepID=A0A4C1Z6W1_EUMVA|nr:hypothetical protein EVAR_58570_1 [Eumeta japonica]